MTSVLTRSSALTARTRPLAGDTKTSFVIDDHLGWLRCDGRGLDKTAYNLLFQVIGYTFGGSASTFNLPNPQGRVVGYVGTVTDDDARTRSYTPGQMVGELDHKLTVNEMASHNHNAATAPPGANTGVVAGTTSSYTHNHGGTTGDAGSAPESETVVGTVVAVHTDAIVAGSSTHNHTIASDTHSHTIASNGGDAYHNNISPMLIVGQLFIYSALPMNGSFPFTTGLSPVLI